jgi:hypothetical protein
MSLPAWNTEALLHKNGQYLQGRDQPFVELIREIMRMRPPDAQFYSIMVGDEIFRYTQIEDIHNQPEFPKAK